MPKSTENVNSKVLKTKNGRSILLSKCAICREIKIKICERARRKGITNEVLKHH